MCIRDRLYIVPAVDQTSPNKGNIYATSLDASGFAIYGRNRLESDPTPVSYTHLDVYKRQRHCSPP